MGMGQMIEQTLSEMTPRERFRIACIAVSVNLLRDAMRRNGDRYSGGLVPNLQSLSDLCVMPFQMLVEQVSAYPPMVEALRQGGEWPPPFSGGN